MTQGHAEPGSADWFVDLASGSGVVFFALQVTPELRFEFINPAVEDLLGYSAEDVLSDPLVMLGRIDPRDAELLARDLEVEPGTHTVAEQRWTHRDGRTLLVRSTTRSVLRPDGSVLLEGTSQDMTSVRQVETELAHSEELYRLLAENAWDVIWTMGVDGSITYVSPSVERVRGITPEEAKSQTLDEIHPPESMASVLDYYTRLGAALQEGTEPPGFRGEHEYYRKDGSIMTGELQVIPHIDAEGNMVQILGVTRDISERKLFEAELTRLADTDVLTGTKSRRRAQIVLADDVAEAHRYDTPMSLLMIDVDHFKQVNDTHGHQVGDDVLREIAQRMMAGLRATDMLARWGGEEFIALLRHCDLEAAFEIAEKLRESVAGEPFGGGVAITMSIGAAELKPDEGLDSWLGRADHALYEAKRAGRDQVSA